MSEHWYTKTGRPSHTMPTKKGAKNPTRPTDIRDAKAFGLLPSVTSIIKMAHNDALERWKLNELARVCWERPPFGEEALAEYASASIKSAQEGAGKAAELGTNIHAAIENHYKGTEVDPAFLCYVEPVAKVIDGLGFNTMSNEVVTVSEKHGYAGTIDLACSNGSSCGVLDFKSTKTKAGEPIAPRISHSAQLAAYYVSYWANGGDIKPNSFAYNIFISTTEVGRVDVVRYDSDQLQQDWEWFLACQILWRRSKGFDPRVPDTKFVG